MEIPLSFKKPGLNKRVCAYLIDFTIAQAITLLFILVSKSNLSELFLIVLMLIRDLFDGQSIGKRIVKIQCLDYAGKPAGTLASLIRNIFIIIPLFPLIEYFLIRFDDYGRRLGDKVSRTIVTDLAPEQKDSTFLGYSLITFLILVLVQFTELTILISRNPELLNKLLK